uniref:Nucleolar protein 16 n=1 Tax=Ditylenchus dipsaci TaxID=166011 RepID=A0A915ENK6_9BILA
MQVQGLVLNSINMRSVKHGGKKTYKYRSRKTVSKKENKKLKKKSKNVNVQNEIVSSEWSSDKTVKQNLESMGLAYDPNRIMGLSLNEPTTADMETEEVGNLEQATTLGSVKEQRKNADKKSVANQLEQAAVVAVKKQKKNREAHLSKDDVGFCMRMTERHGLEFEAMARSSDNIWQYTAKQIQRKVSTFKKSSAYKKAEKDMET